jgi:enoyl-CoA hydratase
MEAGLLMDTYNSNYKFIRFSIDQKVARLVLDDPRTHNSLNREMQLEIKEVLELIKNDREIKLIILSGAGGRSFSVGANINVFKNIDSIEAYLLMRNIGYEIHRLMERIEKPIVAVVNGYCLAGGFELALSCDLIIASEKSIFGLPEINLGIIPGWGGTVRLPKTLPIRKAKELIFLGEQFAAKEAYEMGLINYMVPEAELDQKTEEIISKLLSKSSIALGFAKLSINQASETGNIDSALAIERSAISVLLGSEDSKEGVSAFMEKRKPHFKN